mgnify:CR=1 FL=1
MTLFSTTTSAYSLPEHYEVLLFHLVLCENKASYFNCHFRLLDELWKWKSFSCLSLQKQLIIIIHFPKLVFLRHSLYWVTPIIIIYSHWNFSKSSLSTSSIMIVVFVSYFSQVQYLPFSCRYSVYLFSNNIIIIYNIFMDSCVLNYDSLSDPQWHEPLLEECLDEVCVSILMEIMEEDVPVHSSATPCPRVELLPPCLTMLRLLAEYSAACRHKLAVKFSIYTLVTR